MNKKLSIKILLFILVGMFVTTLFGCTVEFIPHQLSDLIKEVPATCEVDGMKTHYYCDHCGTYYDENKNEVSLESLVLVHPGHEYGELVEEVKASCDQVGMYAHYQCSVCHQFFDEDKDPCTEKDLVIIASHKLGSLIPEVPADCTHTGVKAYYQCSECHEYFTATKNKVEYEDLIIAAKGHQYGELVPEVQVGCETDGCHAYYHCEACQTYFDENKVETTMEGLVITHPGHGYGDLVPAVTVGCEVDGVAAHYYCEACQTYFDENKVVTTLEALTTAHLGHNYGDLVPAVTVSCEVDGVAAHYHCSECGTYFDENKVATTLEALTTAHEGHKYPTEVPGYDLVAQKYYTKQCSVCQEYVYAKVDGCANLDMSMPYVYKQSASTSVVYSVLGVVVSSVYTGNNDASLGKGTSVTMITTVKDLASDKSMPVYGITGAKVGDVIAFKAMITQNTGSTGAQSGLKNLTAVAGSIVTIKNDKTYSAYDLSKAVEVTTQAQLKDIYGTAAKRNNQYGVVYKLVNVKGVHSYSNIYRLCIGDTLFTNATQYIQYSTKSPTCYLSPVVKANSALADYDIDLAMYFGDVKSYADAVTAKGVNVYVMFVGGAGTYYADFAVVGVEWCSNHDAKHVDEVPGDCTNPGFAEHYYCENCDRYFDKDMKPTTREDLVLDNHNYGEWIPKVDQFGDTDGVKGHYECSICHKYFDAEYVEITYLVLPKVSIKEISVKPVEDCFLEEFDISKVCMVLTYDDLEGTKEDYYLNDTIVSPTLVYGENTITFTFYGVNVEFKVTIKAHTVAEAKTLAKGTKTIITGVYAGTSATANASLILLQDEGKNIFLGVSSGSSEFGGAGNPKLVSGLTQGDLLIVPVTLILSTAGATSADYNKMYYKYEGTESITSTIVDHGKTWGINKEGEGILEIDTQQQLRELVVVNALKGAVADRKMNTCTYQVVRVKDPRCGSKYNNMRRIHIGAEVTRNYSGKDTVYETMQYADYKKFSTLSLCVNMVNDASVSPSTPELIWGKACAEASTNLFFDKQFVFEGYVYFIYMGGNNYYPTLSLISANDVVPAQN